MTELSPIVEIELSSDLFDDPCLESMSAPALAILDAYMTGYGWLDSPTKKDCRGVAAALRAAADQVVPLHLLDEPGFSPATCCERVLKEERAEIREYLLDIATELEAQ